MLSASYTTTSPITSFTPVNAVTPAPNVYNNHRITQTPAQIPTNADSHEQKWLTRKADMQVQNYVASRQGAAEGLKKGLLLLSGRESLFQQTTRKSNSDAVEIRDSRKKDSVTEKKTESTNELEIYVAQVAKAQKNTGVQLKSTGMDFSANELFGFRVEVGGKAHEFSISANKNESNESVLTRMAQTVNDRKIGVTASVVSDPQSQTSALEITANRTGTARDQNEMFRVTKREDTNQVRYADAVAVTGLDQVSVQAQNARYYIKENDVLQEKTSPTNDVTLPSNVAVTLRDKTDDFVKITADKNTDATADVAKRIIESLNLLYENAKSHENSDNNARRLSSEISGLAQTYEKQLNNVGVNRTETGHLSIDSERLSGAAQSGKLEQLFQRDNEGFAKRVSHIAGSVFEGVSKGFLLEATI